MSSSFPSLAAQASCIASLIPGLTQRVLDVNNAFDAKSDLVPFEVDGRVLGYVKPSFLKHLASRSDVFIVTSGEGPQAAQRLRLVPSLTTPEGRTAAVAGVLAQLRDAGVITGWRGEPYPVTHAFDAPPALLVERAAAPHFGIRAYGVHVNGWVAGADGRPAKLWVARRSPTKQTWPGKLDHIVAGGQPSGITCRDNVVKECGEEAGVPPELAARAVSVGFVSYVSLSAEGLKPDVLYCYDLQLPSSFQPVPQDGEVSEFTLMDLASVAASMATTQDFKPNVVLVVIDFLVRHGWLTPDMAGYTALVGALRASDAL